MIGRRESIRRASVSEKVCFSKLRWTSKVVFDDFPFPGQKYSPRTWDCWFLSGKLKLA